MSTRQSVCAAFAVALGVAVVGCADDQGAPPEKTFLTVSGTSSIAFAINADHLVEAVTTGATGATGNTQAAAPHGTSFFSASVATGGTFNSGLAGSGAFSSSASGQSSFSSSLATGGTFTASGILTPSSTCNLSELCDFAVAFCDEFVQGNGEQTCAQGASQCDAYVNSPAFQQQLADELSQANIPGGFLCAILDFLECIVHADPTLQTVSDQVAQQCADTSGLGALFQQQAATQ